MSRHDQPYSTAYSLSRILPAEPQAVFDAWTTPSGLAAWCGPEEHDVPEDRAVMDPRVGGRWNVVTVAFDGTETDLGGTVREIDPPRRLVLTTGDPENTDGVPSSVVTLQMVAAEGGTSLHFHEAGVHTAHADAERARQEWQHFFDRLEKHLRST
jgi:uncharacterized protein YndB with AHSA1/START domain